MPLNNIRQLHQRIEDNSPTVKGWYGEKDQVGQKGSENRRIEPVELSRDQKNVS